MCVYSCVLWKMQIWSSRACRWSAVMSVRSAASFICLLWPKTSVMKLFYLTVVLPCGMHADDQCVLKRPAPWRRVTQHVQATAIGRLGDNGETPNAGTPYGPEKLLSVQGALTQILLSVWSHLINILLSVEGKYLWYSISCLMAMVLAWFDMEHVLLDRNPAI